jgi:predicted permease
MFRRLYARLSALWTWNRKVADLDEEIRFHLSEEADERMADGLTPDEARRAAKKSFGNDTRIREDTRDVWGWGSAERLVQDVRYGFRSMRRHPGVSAVSILTLALGIGASTAILNVVQAILLQPLPFPQSERLMVLFATSPKQSLFRDTTSFLDFSAWKDQSHAFTDAAAYRQEAFNVTGDGAPEPVRGLRASHELLRVLSVDPVIGRFFDGQEQHRNDAVVVISHALWTRRYGSDPRIVGRYILLNEISHAVVGVLPPGLRFPPFQSVEVIVPVPERPCRSCGYVRVIARLKPGVPATAAQEELDAIAAGLEKAFPDSNRDRGVNVVPLRDLALGDVRTPLLVLVGAAFLVLLIGCSNVGNLVLAKGIAGRRELAVRSALGAGRGRLVRQLLIESVTLALAAAVLGSLLAFWGSAFLAASLAQQFRLPEVTSDWTLLACAIAMAVLSGSLSGLPPAFMVWRSNLNAGLGDGRRSLSGDRSEHRLSHLLIVFETALTVMLLIGAGLLAKSFLRLQHVELGMSTSRALTADLRLSKRYAEPDRRQIYLRQLLESIGALPGVEAAAAHMDQPFMGGGRRETFRVEGHADPTPGSGHAAAFNIVSRDFFRAMDIPVVRGRGFDERDTAASAPVAVINEVMARQFWPQGNAIGKRLQFYYDKNRARWLSIVGVTRDVRYRGRLAGPAPQVFVPDRQPFYKALDQSISLVVRTVGDPTPFEGAVRSQIWAIDKDQPISNLEPMDRVLWESAAAPRVYMLLVGSFAVIALVIAGGGIYGVSAYAVIRRTREIGIRIALGATSGQMLRVVVRRGMLLFLTGAIIGNAASLALGKVLSRVLYGVAPTDPSAFAGVMLLFGAVAFLSTYVPGRRAARIDPVAAFRSE